MRNRAALLIAGLLLAAPAFAQISTGTDAGFIQLTPQQEKALEKNSTPEPAPKQLEIKGGKDSYVPAPKVEMEARNGAEICDVVAQIIARDFRVMISNPHSASVDIQTIARGPYDVAVKSIVPYSNVYTAMECDGKKLQDTVAGVLRKAVAEGQNKKK